MTGTGTFENYVNVGSSVGATPDGRLSGQPTASDCSAQPFPQVDRHLMSSKAYCTWGITRTTRAREWRHLPDMFLDCCGSLGMG